MFTSQKGIENDFYLNDNYLLKYLFDILYKKKKEILNNERNYIGIIL